MVLKAAQLNIILSEDENALLKEVADDFPNSNIPTLLGQLEAYASETSDENTRKEINSIIQKIRDEYSDKPTALTRFREFVTGSKSKWWWQQSWKEFFAPKSRHPSFGTGSDFVPYYFKLGLKLGWISPINLDLERVDLGRKCAPFISLNNTNLNFAILKGADLSFMDFRGSNLSNTDLTGANLYYSKLEGANLRDADLQRADLNGARLNHSHLSYANLSDANLCSAKLNGAQLDGANLSNADMTHAKLEDANLEGADLSNADIGSANLEDANLNGANLSRTNLVTTTLSESTTFKESLIWKTKFSNEVSLAQLKEAILLQPLNVDAGAFKGYTLSGKPAYMFDQIKPFLKHIPNNLVDELEEISSRIPESKRNGFYSFLMVVNTMYSDNPRYWIDFIQNLSQLENKDLSKTAEELYRISLLNINLIQAFLQTEISSNHKPDNQLALRKYNFLLENIFLVISPSSEHLNFSITSLQSLSLQEKMKLIFDLGECRYQDNGKLTFAKAVFDSMPSKFHQDTVKSNLETLKSGRKGQFYLYLYYGGPALEIVWKRYCEMNYSKAYLDRLHQQVNDYRLGKKQVNVYDEDSLMAGFIALDQPAMDQNWNNNPVWSFEFYKKRMIEMARGPQIPPLFLNHVIRFKLNRTQNVHAVLDKTAINESVTKLMSVSNLDETKNWLVSLSQSSPKILRALLRSTLIEKLNLATNTDLKTSDNQAKLRDYLAKDENALSLIATIYQKINGSSQSDGTMEAIRERLLLTLAFLRPGLEASRKIISDYHQEAMSGNKTYSTDNMAKVLNALYQILEDGVAEIRKSMGSTSEIPNAIKNMNQKLKAESEKIKTLNIGKAVVELIPSKLLLDQFFGYIGEDCTKDRYQEILKENFMVYKIIVDNQLEGMIYLNRTEKKLTIAIAPRRRLNVSMEELLEGIEKGLLEVVKKEGYQTLYIPTSTNQMGNLPTMAQAIVNRNYQKETHANARSSLFSTGEHFKVTLRPDKENPIKVKVMDYNSYMQRHHSIIRDDLIRRHASRLKSQHRVFKRVTMRHAIMR